MRYNRFVIKAVIFDCFGVLTADGWKHLREELWGRDSEKLQRACDMEKAVNAGFIKYDEFITEISRMSKLNESEVRRRISGASPNSLLFEYMRDSLKPRVKIGMLSNAAGDWLGDLFEPRQTELFDATVLSYQVGAVKPELAMYQAIIDRLGVQFNECVFVDDSEGYCASARNLGMKAIWHQDTHDTIAAIEEIINA